MGRRGRESSVLNCPDVGDGVLDVPRRVCEASVFNFQNYQPFYIISIWFSETILIFGINSPTKKKVDIREPTSCSISGCYVYRDISTSSTRHASQGRRPLRNSLVFLSNNARPNEPSPDGRGQGEGRMTCFFKLLFVKSAKNDYL